MGNSLLKLYFRQFYKYFMNRAMSEYDEEDMRRSAIIFAPHPDDETLGCGGTIIKKRKAGADVKIVFMTDGSKSHINLISQNELKSIRASEAIRAAQKLGVLSSDVVFFEFENGKLSEYSDSAENKVIEIILHQEPEEIFIPYYKEAPSDHHATNKIVLSALRMCNRKANIYEYPIWFWQHWPWTSLPINSRRRILKFSKSSFFSGLSLLRDFRCSIYVGDVLELKHAALDQYKSQMTRLISDPRWRTLSDVSDGEFLQCFFQEHDIFHHYSYPDNNKISN